MKGVDLENKKENNKRNKLSGEDLIRCSGKKRESSFNLASVHSKVTFTKKLCHLRNVSDTSFKHAYYLYFTETACVLLCHVHVDGSMFT